MNEITLPSGHRIGNSSPVELRPSKLPFKSISIPDYLYKHDTINTCAPLSSVRGGSMRHRSFYWLIEYINSPHPVGVVVSAHCYVCTALQWMGKMIFTGIFVGVDNYTSMASKLIIQLISRVHPDHLLNVVVSGCTCWLTWISQLATVLSRGNLKDIWGMKKTNAALCGPRYLLWIPSQYEKLAQFNDVPSSLTMDQY